MSLRQKTGPFQDVGIYLQSVAEGKKSPEDAWEFISMRMAARKKYSGVLPPCEIVPCYDLENTEDLKWFGVLSGLETLKKLVPEYTPDMLKADVSAQKLSVEEAIHIAGVKVSVIKDGNNQYFHPDNSAGWEQLGIPGGPEELRELQNKPQKVEPASTISGTEPK